ncbi:TRAP transporter substrate-binding protein [Oricola sp.]|uniref:TRAP transporter substrate-binding protein n=1 Tax=Oricola sp. TaxID=1979950 RepID=UPI000C8F5AB0|nr:TRAP transporter substrate-binding protein [uncultured Psychrobacter sp.]MAZ17215.1 C4-dicarboxylate ABC transporter [Ahrensia sp.]|tara:strand:- start:40662 stop:41675 length:1014 start_codon:yes stop_codon:yes gene_type:complete
MKKTIGILAALVLGTTAAQAQDVTLRLSHWLPPQHAVPQTGMKEWMESITEDSGGSIKFEVFPAQQLGAAPDHYDMTRDGIADIGYVNPGYNAGRFPVFELVGVPFLGKDGANAAKAIHEWYLDYAAKEMSDVYFCLVNPHNPGRFHANTEIKVPADVKGLSVRPAHSTMARFVNSLGGSSVQVPAPEAREALARGSADAVTFPYEAMKIFNIAEETKFHNDMPLYLSAQVMLLNKASYDGLSDEQRTIIDNHCTPEWSKRFSAGWADYDNGVREEIMNNPEHTVYTPTAEEVQLWRDAAVPTLEAWKEDVKAKGYDADTVLEGLRSALAANNTLYE